MRAWQEGRGKAAAERLTCCHSPYIAVSADRLRAELAEHQDFVREAIECEVPVHTHARTHAHSIALCLY
jgi:hypothetical protein